MRTVTADRGKKIQLFDDLLSLQQRQRLFSFIQKSRFQIGWADGAIAENQSNQFLHSAFSNEDLDRFAMFDYIQDTELSAAIEDYCLNLAIVNLSMPSDYNFIHAHPEDKVLLYYANLEWKDGWHGETLFFDEACRDVVFASPYTPGRFILFDADIPHTIRPQSIIAAKYRFTFAATLMKKP